MLPTWIEIFEIRIHEKVHHFYLHVDIFMLTIFLHVYNCIYLTCRLQIYNVILTTILHEICLSHHSSAIYNIRCRSYRISQNFIKQSSIFGQFLLFRLGIDNLSLSLSLSLMIYKKWHSEWNLVYRWLHHINVFYACVTCKSVNILPYFLW